MTGGRKPPMIMLFAYADIIIASAVLTHPDFSGYRQDQGEGLTGEFCRRRRSKVFKRGVNVDGK